MSPIEKFRRSLIGFLLLAVAGAGLMVGLPYLVATYFTWEGDQLQKSGNLNGAAAAYQKALDVQPSPNTMVKLGTTFLKENKPRSAAAVLKRAVTMAPRDSSAHYALAVHLMNSGDLPEARHQLGQAITLDEGNGLAHLALSDLAQKEGNRPLAIHELQQAVENGANTPDAHLRMGEAYLAKSDPRAEKEFQAALAVDPSCSAAHLRLGYLLLNRNPAEATRHLQTALDLGLDSVNDRARALAALGLLAYRGNNLAEASTYLHQAADLHPEPDIMASLDYGIAILRRDTANASGAFQAFTSAVQDNPRLPAFQMGAMVGRMGLYGDGLNAMHEGRLADAERNFKSLVAMAPKEPEYHLQLGTACLFRGNSAGALSQFSTTLLLAPRNPEAWLKLSATYLQSGRIQESANAMTRALRLAPQWTRFRPDVDVLLGKIDMALNRPQAAQLCFQYAANSHSPTVNFDECMVLLQTATQRVQQMTASAPVPANALPQSAVQNPLSSSTAPLPESSPAAALPSNPAQPVNPSTSTSSPAAFSLSQQAED